MGGRASAPIIAEGAHARSVGRGASEPLPSSRLRRAVGWQRNSDVSSFKQPCHTSSHMSSQARPLSLHQLFGRGLTDISSSTSAGTRGRGMWRKGGVGGQEDEKELLCTPNKVCMSVKVYMSVNAYTCTGVHVCKCVYFVSCNPPPSCFTLRPPFPFSPPPPPRPLSQPLSFLLSSNPFPLNSLIRDNLDKEFVLLCFLEAVMSLSSI